MSIVPHQALRRILTASLNLFGRNGYQRTSMADIAREAEIARATLYLYFSDKDSLFEALATSLVDEALERVESAWVSTAPLSENLTAVLLAKDLGFFHMIHATPHGSELLDLHAERAANHVVRLQAGFVDLVVRQARAAVKGGADMTAFDDVDGFASFLADAGSGLKHEARTEDAFRLAIRRLAIVTARAAGCS